MQRPVYVMEMVGIVPASNRHQDIRNHHADSVLAHIMQHALHYTNENKLYFREIRAPIQYKDVILPV